MRNQVKQFLKMFGHALSSAVSDRLDGVELRLDDLRTHSNQVEAKVDYLITLLTAQCHQLEIASQGIGSQVQALTHQTDDLKERIEDLKGRTQHLAQNHGAMLQGAIHIVESIHRIEQVTKDSSPHARI
jgi:hypothetical protein